MTFDDAIRILKKHIGDCDSPFFLFESWLDTTLELVDKICGRASTQYMNFISLRSEFRVSKIGQNPNQLQKLENTYKYRSKQQLSGIIEQLQEERNQANIRQQEEQGRHAIEKQQADQKKKELIERQIAFNEESKRQQKQIQQEKRPNKKMFFNNGKTYVIGISLFWAVLIPSLTVITSAAYFIGNTKYDIDKNNLVEENTLLKNQNEVYKETSLKDSLTIRALQKRINHLDSLSRTTWN